VCPAEPALSRNSSCSKVRTRVSRILRDQYPTQRRPEARPRARSRRFTIWKALLVMITQRGFSCASVTALLSTTPVRSLAGRFFLQTGVSGRPGGRMATACACKRRQESPRQGTRERKNPAKAGPSRTHVCLRGVGASTCLPTRRRRSQPTPLPRSCARRTYARRLKKARSRVLPGRVGSWTNAGCLPQRPISLVA
jgi:hypothetical protein